MADPLDGAGGCDLCADHERFGKPPPGFYFFPLDFIGDADVLAMTWRQRGLYIWLLALCWREGRLPAAPAAIARLCSISGSFWKSSRGILLRFVECECGRYRYHLRMMTDRATHYDKSSKQREKALKRWRTKDATASATAMPRQCLSSPPLSESECMSSSRIGKGTGDPPTQGGHAVSKTGRGEGEEDPETGPEPEPKKPARRRSKARPAKQPPDRPPSEAEKTEAFRMLIELDVVPAVAIAELGAHRRAHGGYPTAARMAEVIDAGRQKTTTEDELRAWTIAAIRRGPKRGKE